MKTKLALLIFVISIIVSLSYSFGTNWYHVSDASRDYWLYNYYRVNPVWHPMDWKGSNGLDTDGMMGKSSLQNMAVFSSYVPAVIQNVTRLPSDWWFKLYIALMVACVPVAIYYLSYLLLKSWYAVFPAIYAIGWVTFFQGESYARLNIAVLVFAMLVISLLSKRMKPSLLLAAILPLAHYGVALVSIGCLGLVIVAITIAKKWDRVWRLGVVVCVLVASFVLWEVVVNKVMIDSVQDITSGRISIQVNGAVTSNHTASPDKITQAMFGNSNPDNDNVYHLNLWLLFFAWLTVVLLGIGYFVLVRGEYPLEIKVLVSALYFCLCAVIVCAQLSRGYGVEKIFYQVISVAGIGLVLGSNKIAGKIKVPSWVILSVVLVPYVILMWNFGRIVSIQG